MIVEHYQAMKHPSISNISFLDNSRILSNKRYVSNVSFLDNDRTISNNEVDLNL